MPVVDMDETDPALIGLTRPPPRSSIVVVLLAAELSRESVVSRERLSVTRLRGIGSGGLSGRFAGRSFMTSAAVEGTHEINTP